MIYRYISSATAIARLNRYFDDRNWIMSARMDLGDGIQDIGLATKQDSTCYEAPAVIVNHKLEIPCELEFLEKIEDMDGNRIPLNKDSSMLALTNDTYKWSKNETNLGNWYSVQPPYFKFSYSEGEVMLFYRKYSCDENGFIYIPDVSSYREALVWFMIRSLIMMGYKPKSNQITLDYAEMMYDKYKRKAKTACKSFSRDERQRFSRYWNSLNLEYTDNNPLMDTQ